MATVKVLLVDDDVDFVRIHKTYLERAGFVVAVAYGGEEGLAKARAEKPDIVVLDYVMARPTEGSFVAMEMKEDPQLKDVPILLLTSMRAQHPWWGVQKSDARLPVDAFLDKPVAVEKLIAEINRLVGTRSAAPSAEGFLRMPERVPWQASFALGAGDGKPTQSQRAADYVAQMMIAAARVSGCLVCEKNGSRSGLRLLARRGLKGAGACRCETIADSGIAAAMQGEWSSWYDPSAQPAPQYCAQAQGVGMAARLCLPLMLGNTPAGVIQLFSASARDFAMGEVAGLHWLANAGAVALDNARLYDRAATLFDLARTLSATMDQGQVGDLIAERVAKAMGAKGCTIRILDRMSGRLDHVGSYGLSRKYLWDKGPVLASESIRDALDGKPTAVYNVADSPRVQYPAAAIEEGIASIASIPMVVKGVVTGVLRIYTARPYEFTPEDMTFLCAAAEVAGAAVENARLYDGIQHDFNVLMDEIVYMRRAARAAGGGKDAQP